MKSVDPILPNFFVENDYRFDGLRGTRDTVSRQLREDGVGSSVKHAEVITYEEEDKLWDREVLGSSTPKADSLALEIRIKFLLTTVRTALSMYKFIQNSDCYNYVMCA